MEKILFKFLRYNYPMKFRPQLFGLKAFFKTIFATDYLAQGQDQGEISATTILGYLTDYNPKNLVKQPKTRISPNIEIKGLF